MLPQIGYRGMHLTEKACLAIAAHIGILATRKRETEPSRAFATGGAAPQSAAAANAASIGPDRESVERKMIEPNEGDARTH